MGSVKTSPFSVPGTYEIEYVMVDEQGNRGSRTRTLVVTAASSSSGLSPGGAAGVVLVLLLLIALAASSYSSTSASTTAAYLVTAQPLFHVTIWPSLFVSYHLRHLLRPAFASCASLLAGDL